MERINEFAGEHQLAYLEKHLNITKATPGEWKRKAVYKPNGGWRIRKVYLTTNKPVPLSYFTVGELHYILNTIAENYLIKTHLVAFATRPKENFLIKLIEDEYSDK